MALRYPGSAPIPEYESSLAKFMPAFEKGQAERRDSDAFDAAAQAFGGGAGPAPEQPSSPLERLMGNLFGGQKQGPFTRPETAVAAIDAAAPMTPGAPVADTTGLPAGYLDNARSAESGGDDAAANPNSSALGRYQFLDSTWQGLMQQYPELGLTPNGRTDPAQQERAMAKFTQDNARTLSGSGIPVNPGTLYAAHFLGAGGAQKALTADPATPMSALVDPGVISANPHLQGMTAGDFAQWAQRKGGGGSGGASGGYTPPMQDVGAGQGRPFTVDEGTMRTLLASEATRPLAVSLIQAQQETQASQGRFVTEQGDDGSIWQRDTLTGEQKVIREAPTPKQQRIVQGPDGNSYYEDGSRVLPGVDAPAPAPDAPNVVTRYNQQTGQEEKVVWNPATGTFDPFGGQKAAGNGLTVTTNPDGTTTVQQGGPALKLTEQQSKDVGFLAKSNAANDTLETIDSELTNLFSRAAGADPTGLAREWMQSDAFQKAENAALEFKTAILRKDSGAAITPSEDAQYDRLYIPQPGDGLPLIAQKREARARAVAAIQAGLPSAAIAALEEQGLLPMAIEQAQGATPQASQPAQAGPVPIADDAQYDALPSGTQFQAPDGTIRVKP